MLDYARCFGTFARLKIGKFQGTYNYAPSETVVNLAASHYFGPISIKNTYLAATFCRSRFSSAAHVPYVYIIYANNH